ncbi:MAG: hypothetical protein Q8M07_13790 [Prosthecobacter sp.]|nr:hypothetical protein [Prosthecobacter sp.]
MNRQRNPIPAASSAWARQLHFIAILGFAAGVLGYYLSWGVHIINDPFIRSKIVHTGATAGIYGKTTLGIAIMGFLMSLLAFIRYRLPVSGMLSCTCGIVGLLVLFSMRFDPQVTVFGTMSYAWDHGDYTLGFTLGPGTAILGFIAAVFASLAGHSISKMATLTECPVAVPIPAQFHFYCPHCDQHISTTTDTIGAEAECPVCQMAIIIPAPSNDG